MNATTLGCAYLLDLVAGDPEWLPHPVRVIGRAIGAAEDVMRPGDRSPGVALMSGACLTAAVVGGTWLTARAVLAHRSHPWIGLAIEGVLAWTSLATGSLLLEARGVLDALDRGDLVGARARLGRIVGRDTAALDEPEIARGVIETLAESTCDGIVAPLCFLAVGGVPAALAYKAVNTLDSMIGHREPPYIYFGRVAARLDDVANYVPARLAAVALAVAAACTGARPREAVRVWWRDHTRHDSPNAGHPESAMAGALGVRLGGTNEYGGVPHRKPIIGAGGAVPGAQAARQACRIVTMASLLAAGVAVLGLAAAGAR